MLIPAPPMEALLGAILGMIRMRTIQTRMKTVDQMTEVIMNPS